MVLDLRSPECVEEILTSLDLLFPEAIQIIKFLGFLEYVLTSGQEINSNEYFKLKES